MATVKMISESDATGKVRKVYDEIKATLGIDFVPNLYKVMASKPGYLEANWNKVKAVMVEHGKLDRLTKEIIAVAVSAVQGCRY
jgi:alkylhydroperoxidase/carboxymuconolactone decarboxylase family protein YurZ